MIDGDLLIAFVGALDADERESLARGPASEGDGTGCGVCNALRDEGYTTGRYRGHRQAQDWLLNWHQADPVRCGVIYGVAIAMTEEDQSV